MSSVSFELQKRPVPSFGAEVLSRERKGETRFSLSPRAFQGSTEGSFFCGRLSMPRRNFPKSSHGAFYDSPPFFDRCSQENAKKRIEKSHFCNFRQAGGKRRLKIFRKSYFCNFPYALGKRRLFKNFISVILGGRSGESADARFFSSAASAAALFSRSCFAARYLVRRFFAFPDKCPFRRSPVPPCRISSERFFSFRGSFRSNSYTLPSRIPSRRFSAAEKSGQFTRRCVPDPSGTNADTPRSSIVTRPGSERVNTPSAPKIAT